MNRISKCGLYVTTTAVIVTLALTALRADSKSVVGPSPKQLSDVRQRAIDYLRTSQSADGSWTTPTSPGITALVTVGLVQNGLTDSSKTIKKAIAHLETFIQKDGGIYFLKSNHRNYETSISLLAFHTVNKNGKYDKVISNAEKFLRGLQWDGDEGLPESNPGFGGAGYGKHQRPDLSNTQFLLEALKAAGVKSDDQAMQKALKFVSRCQNLETENNTTPHAAKVNDGGFYYTAAAGGSSQAGLTANGGLRSYGSMTYAGLKSMIYAGLTAEDPRVKAATEWIKKSYSVDVNPGLGKQGLYYYYQTFAKTLSVLKLDYLTDAKGQKHDWRKELAGKLAELQNKNGSWTNRAERWYEGDPNLATAYSLLALSHCDQRPIKK